MIISYRCLSANASLRQAVKTVAEAQRILPPGRMKAWRLHGYGPLSDLKFEEARIPPLRSPDELLVRVHATSINPLDVNMIGGYGARILNVLRSFEGSEGVEFPLVPGRDFVGVVERAGSHARLRPGQRVWGVVPPHRPGAHAEYVVVKDSWAGPAPSTLDNTQAGGALYAALSASAAVRVGGVDPGSRVLLLGLGGVGHAALQLLVSKRAQVVVGCAGDLCETALQLGASAALDRHAADYQAHIAECGPYDVVLDCAGLGGGGAGGARARRYVTLTTPLLANTDQLGLLLGAQASLAALLGQCVGAARSGAAECPPSHVRWAFFSPSAEDIQLFYKLAEEHRFTVGVGRVFAWWEGAAAYEVASQPHARGKILLDFTVQPSS